ncbi:MAG: hypothetical protein IMW90_09800 [Thermogemmatispora sp.]|nr:MULTISPECIES: hypothetical protein [Thermogemmatispora]MBE3566008.1 hypothetical protein [Thermogemmatispora sp.]
MSRKQAPLSMYEGSRRARRRWPILVGVSIPLLLLLIAAGVVVLPHLTSRAADDNTDCSLIVPPNPLSAQGLATPYQLVATNPANGPCHEANPAQAAFVQGAILDPRTGQISIYNPLVVDQGTQPAVQPTPPKLPQGAVVALWFGFNGNNLTLVDNNGSLRQGRCVNGVNGSIFSQFAYCNAPAFFAAANYAIRSGRLKVPPIGTAKDGQPCPTTRDFSLVDQDQSDNVVTEYLVTADGRIAQMTAANAAALQGAQVQTNGSDERLLSIGLDSALGCTPWMAPDLADPGHTVAALPLNELQAALYQKQPVALVPAGDPMVLNNGQPDLRKLNAYRVGVDQPPVGSLNQASTATYCQNLINVAPARLKLDQQFTQASPSPDAGAANSLFTFLAQRFVTTYQELNCQALINLPDPITVTTDANGVAVDATINVPNGGGNGGDNGNGNGQGTTVNCSVNGRVIQGCSGTVTINGAPCTLMLDQANHQVVIQCTRRGTVQPQ